MNTDVVSAACQFCENMEFIYAFFLGLREYSSCIHYVFLYIRPRTVVDTVSCVASYDTDLGFEAEKSTRYLNWSNWDIPHRPVNNVTYVITNDRPDLPALYTYAKVSSGKIYLLGALNFRSRKSGDGGARDL